MEIKEHFPVGEKTAVEDSRNVPKSIMKVTQSLMDRKQSLPN